MCSLVRLYFYLKSNIHQRCFFFTATVHYTLTGAGKHLSCKESSKNIFANSIIRFNAPINYCFCCLCCLIWLTFNSYSIIISLPPRIAFSSVLSWQGRQKMITPWYKFWFKYLFFTTLSPHITTEVYSHIAISSCKNISYFFHFKSHLKAFRFSHNDGTLSGYFGIRSKGQRLKIETFHYVPVIINSMC